MLKTSLAVVLVMWLAGLAMLFFQPAPFGLASGEDHIYSGLAPVLAEPISAGAGNAGLAAGAELTPCDLTRWRNLQRTNVWLRVL